MNTIERILDNYNKLCAYCDGFFSSIYSEYENDIRCRKGCCACCEIHSVCALEAHVIARNIVSAGSLRHELLDGHGKGGCVMLRRNRCAVYGSRPVICRTHGLIVSMDKGKTVVSSCELNFAKRDVRKLPKQHVFDAAVITDNLMRLNMAYCMVIGHASFASRRFTMEQVLCGRLPKCIL